MGVGYPDYARLSQAGGSQLYAAANSAPPYFTKLFQGYVGSWPYINVFTNLASSTDFMEIVFAYCSDSTFNTVVGERFAIRTGGSEAVTQYANLTDWLTFWYVTKSGNPMTFTEFSVFANTGPAGQIQLADNSGPIEVFDTSVPASSIGTVQVNGIQPGAALFTWDVTAASWEIDVNFYSWSAGAYIRALTMKSGSFAQQGIIQVPMIDAPYQLVLKNNDTVSNVMNTAWYSE